MFLGTRFSYHHTKAEHAIQPGRVGSTWCRCFSCRTAWLSPPRPRMETPPCFQKINTCLMYCTQSSSPCTIEHTQAQYFTHQLRTLATVSRHSPGLLRLGVHPGRFEFAPGQTAQHQHTRHAKTTTVRRVLLCSAACTYLENLKVGGRLATLTPARHNNNTNVIVRVPAAGLLVTSQTRSKFASG